MKYWLILPGAYSLLMLLFFVVLLLGAGHGPNPFEFVLYLIYPARFLLELIPSSRSPNLFPLFLLFVLAGLIQWALVGYLIDKMIAWRRNQKLTRK